MKDKKTVAIIGLGLLGTSLALALKDNPEYEVIGWTRKEDVRNDLLSKEIITKTGENPHSLLPFADITVLCLPIPAIIGFCFEFADAFKSGSVVTDVGSVKKIICDSVNPYLDKHGVTFVGGHPMAGTEKSGSEAAFSELYKRALVFLTPDGDGTTEEFWIVEKLWKSVDARVMRICPNEHDRLVAETSHLTHLVAWALVDSVLNDTSPEWALKKSLTCSSAFRDTTRITSSSPRMWREIIENNHNSVVHAMDQFDQKFKKMRRIIEAKSYDDLEKWFNSGKTLRDKWKASHMHQIK